MPSLPTQDEFFAACTNDLMAVGGVLYVDLLALPPPSKPVNAWVLRQVSGCVALLLWIRLCPYCGVPYIQTSQCVGPAPGQWKCSCVVVEQIMSKLWCAILPVHKYIRTTHTRTHIRTHTRKHLLSPSMQVTSFSSNVALFTHTHTHTHTQTFTSPSLLDAGHLSLQQRRPHPLPHPPCRH